MYSLIGIVVQVLSCSSLTYPSLRLAVGYSWAQSVAICSTASPPPSSPFIHGRSTIFSHVKHVASLYLASTSAINHLSPYSRLQRRRFLLFQPRSPLPSVSSIAALPTCAVRHFTNTGCSRRQCHCYTTIVPLLEHRTGLGLGPLVIAIDKEGE